MDALIVLVALLVLAIPVSIIVLLIGQGHLRRRVTQLEKALSEMGEARLAARVNDLQPTDEVLPAAELAVRVDQAAPLAEAVAAPSPDSSESEAAGKATPWDLATKAGKKPPTDAGQNQPIVLRPDRVSALVAWLKHNWVYAISALSLALAGVFFVQYGMEKGLLPPAARVIAAIVFGGALVGVGEWMRRRHGDEGPHHAAYLPSVFSGAGLVSIFAAVIAARQMYGLIGPETAFGGLFLTAALAVGLGWFYGPLLVAVGLLGAAVAPFIVSGGSSPGVWLYGYFALVATVGLSVDAVRRWAWVSGLALLLAYGGAVMVMLAGAGTPGWIAALIGLAVLSVILPNLQLIPRHEGPSTVLSAIRKGKAGWPVFPVRLAAGAVLTSTLGLVFLAGSVEAEALLALIALTLLAVALLLWADKAEGLADLAYLPALGLVASLAIQGFAKLPLQQNYLVQALDLRGPEVAAPMTISWLLLMAAIVGAAFAWRSFRAGSFRIADSLAAALIAPVAAATLELLWHPALVIGAYPWALQVIALAAAMVLLALRYAKIDGADRRRFAYATLSALSLIALALFLVATSVALTLALAVLTVAAAGLDRRFNLAEMRFFIQISAAVLWFRLFGNPGIDWAMVAPIGQVILAFGGVIAAFVAALKLLDPLDRPTATGVLESAAVGLIAVLLNILITRRLIPEIDAEGLETYWGATVNALPWSILMLVQLYRVRLGGPMKRVRQGIALVAGWISVGGLAMAAGPFNPLIERDPTAVSGKVEGPLVFDSIALAYLLPALLFGIAAWKMPGLGRRLKLAFFALAGVLGLLYLGLEIRRYWGGDWLGRPGVVQGELYNYTVALMLIGAGLLYLAIRRRSRLLRRVAMAVIAFTIAKVFLFDAAGLTGLTRVVSFLGLGLSLAGLAWLNRWAGQVSDGPPKEVASSE